MENSLSAMETALRVLSALTHRKNLDPNDEDELRRLAGNTQTGNLDELACEVIQRAIHARAKARGEPA